MAAQDVPKWVSTNIHEALSVLTYEIERKDPACALNIFEDDGPYFQRLCGEQPKDFETQIQ